MNLKELMEKVKLDTSWKVDENGELPPCVIEDTEEGMGIAECVSRDAAALIVHCVNNFARLVAALEWITRCAKMSGPAGTTAWFISEGHMEKCRSLVAAAQNIPSGEKGDK